MRRQELGLIKQIAQDAFQSLARRDREEPMATAGLAVADGAGKIGRFLRNQFMRLLKPGNNWHVSSSRISTAIRGSNPTSERVRSGTTE